MAKNRNNTKEYTRIATLFGSRTNYDMFCVYWAHLCTKLNPNTVNRINLGGNEDGKKEKCR